MSAPQTNVERQKRRHRGAIAGISAGLAFAVVLVLASGWLGGTEEAAAPTAPDTALPATEPMVDPTAPPATAADEQVAPAN